MTARERTPNPLAPARSWVDDHCTNPSLPSSLKHAEGILSLHRTCTPPCPRKRAAQWWMDKHGQVQG